ncbi:hypothetical protein J2X14_002700 [Pantoea alhagi]|uniref:hypothetical protein n=1 Tax=Mixta sp. BE291 TaxID=3158787 RepID=UPI00285F7514|nr:hypothetical protein [Pantoea alhagi]
MKKNYDRLLGPAATAAGKGIGGIVGAVAVTAGGIMARNVPGNTKYHLRNIIIIPGVFLGWAFLSSSHVTPQSWLSVIPCDIARFFVIIMTVFGTVELLMKFARWFIPER